MIEVKEVKRPLTVDEFVEYVLRQCTEVVDDVEED